MTSKNFERVPYGIFTCIIYIFLILKLSVLILRSWDSHDWLDDDEQHLSVMQSWARKKRQSTSRTLRGCRKMLCFVQFWTRKSGTKSIKQRWRTGRVVFHRNFENDKSGARNDKIHIRKKESHNVTIYCHNIMS